MEDAFKEGDHESDDIPVVHVPPEKISAVIMAKDLEPIVEEGPIESSPSASIDHLRHSVSDFNKTLDL